MAFPIRSMLHIGRDIHAKIMTKLEQVAFATDAFAANGRTHTDIKITPDTKIDQVITPLQETFQQRLGNGMVGEFFLIASKWQPFVGLTFGV